MGARRHGRVRHAAGALLLLSGCSEPTLAPDGSAQPLGRGADSDRSGRRAQVWSERLEEAELRRTLPPQWQVGQRWVVRNRSRVHWRAAEVEPEAGDTFEWFVVRELEDRVATVDVVREAPRSAVRLSFVREPFYLAQAVTLDANGQPGAVFYSARTPAAFRYAGREEDPEHETPPACAEDVCSPFFPSEPVDPRALPTAHRVGDGITFWLGSTQPAVYWRAGEPWPSTLLSSHRCVLCLVRNADGTPFVPTRNGELPPPGGTWTEPAMVVPPGVFAPQGPQWEDARTIAPSGR